MFIANNYTILWTFSVLRGLLGYLLIFHTNWNLILKTYLLFFPLGLDDLDSVYPYLLNLYKSQFSWSVEVLGDLYIILDKINDIFAAWMMFYYIYQFHRNTLQSFHIWILLGVLLYRTWADLLYVFKSKLKILTISESIFVIVPDLFSVYLMSFLVQLQFDWEFSWVILGCVTILKLAQEYYLHIGKFNARIWRAISH